MASRIASFAVDHLCRHGPSTITDIHAAARAAGATLASSTASVASALRFGGGFVLLPDGRYDAAARVLEGAVLTHRVRYPTAGRTTLWAGVDLEVLELLSPTGRLPLRGGGELVRRRGTPVTWHGPAGWLPVLGRDELLHVRLVAGTVHVRAGAPPDGAESPHAVRVREMLRRHLRPDRPDARPVASALLRALVEAPDLLRRAVPPLDELLTSTPAGRLGGARRDGPRVAPTTPASPGRAPAGAVTVRVELPRALHGELARRSGLLGMEVEDYAMQVLAAEAWRATAPPDASERAEPSGHVAQRAAQSVSARRLPAR